MIDRLGRLTVAPSALHWTRSTQQSRKWGRTWVLKIRGVARPSFWWAKRRKKKEERVLSEEVMYLILYVERLNCELVSTRERGRKERKVPGRAFLNYFILSLYPYISFTLTLLWSYIIIKYIHHVFLNNEPIRVDIVLIFNGWFSIRSGTRLGPVDVTTRSTNPSEVIVRCANKLSLFSTGLNLNLIRWGKIMMMTWWTTSELYHAPSDILLKNYSHLPKIWPVTSALSISRNLQDVWPV